LESKVSLKEIQGFLFATNVYFNGKERVARSIEVQVGGGDWRSIYYHE
jgi:hypothetical protein